MKSINIEVLLCLINIAVASCFVFLQNVKVTATELKLGKPITNVLVPYQVSDLGLLGKNIFELKCQS